jgi:hypothetical protein
MLFFNRLKSRIGICFVGTGSAGIAVAMEKHSLIHNPFGTLVSGGFIAGFIFLVLGSYLHDKLNKSQKNM